MNHHPIILLHGWGFSSQLWQPLMQNLHAQGCEAVYAIDLPGFGTAFHEPCESLDQVLEYIAEQLPEKSVLCGWSLGGMLALQMAARHPEKVAAIITIGSNLHFTDENNITKASDWPGMPAADYQQFCQRFAAQPEKTWHRFLQLQTKGDSNAGQAADALDSLADYSVIHPATAGKMLQLLGEIDNRTAFEKLLIPGLHVLAERDVITPVAIAALLRQINSGQAIKILPDAGHALPVSQPDVLAVLIVDFLVQKKQAQKKSVVVKPRVAESFSRAADSYDSAAQLQRNIGTALLATLPASMTGTVLDIGCGTGFVTGQLLQKYASSIDVVALDFAAGMLDRTHQQYASALCVQADMEYPPFADNSASWIVSNLALQWASDVTKCFQQWRRVLQPDGHLLFATFLPGTLRELESSWQAVDESVHVNHFVEKTVLVSALQNAGFASVEAVCATHTLYYSELAELTRELKSIGARNMNHGQPAGLTGKRRWQQLQAAYEALRSARGLPATYEVLYVSAC